jgi:hypothetical protein
VANHTVKFVQCDNAGENVKQLQDACENEMAITMEYIAPYTPEQNGVVEQAFASVQNRGYAMMIDARLMKALQGQWWSEAMDAATSLANITASSTHDTTASTMKCFITRSRRCIRIYNLFGVLDMLPKEIRVRRIFWRKASSVFVSGTRKKSRGGCLQDVQH